MEVIGELHGHSCIGRLMLFYARGPSSIVDHRNSIGAANAGLVFFHDQLNFSMVPHPKVNPTCVELIRLSYDVTSKFLMYFRLSSEEEKSPDVEIPLDTPTMTHDFAITENSVVIPDHGCGIFLKCF